MTKIEALETLRRMMDGDRRLPPYRVMAAAAAIARDAVFRAAKRGEVEAVYGRKLDGIADPCKAMPGVGEFFPTLHAGAEALRHEIEQGGKRKEK